MADTNAPSKTKVVFTIVGRAVNTVIHALTRGKQKGKPVAVPDIAGETPTMNEFVSFLPILGQENILKALWKEIVVPIWIEASVNSLVQDTDGSWRIDAGKLAVQVPEIASEYTAVSSKVDELRQEQLAIADELNKAMAVIFGNMKDGKKTPDDFLNRALVLQSKHQELLVAIANKGRKAKTPATAKPPVAATPAATPAAK